MPLPPPETSDINDRGRGGGYGRHDTHRLNPGRLTQPLPETVELLVDERSAAMMPLLGDIPHLDVSLTRLPVGDLCAVHGDGALLFVTTSADELCTAMDDGRLGRLVADLGRVAHPAALIVEGGLYSSRSQPLPRLAALQCRMTFGVSVPIIETLDRRHTAYAVVCCARDRFFPAQARARFEPRPAPPIVSDAHDVARLMLETVPGVSHGRASALLDRFGTIAAIADASEKEVAGTDGIGRVTASRLLATLAGGTVAPGRRAALPDRWRERTF